MFYYSIEDTIIGLFDGINAPQHILNVLLVCIESFNIVLCILYVPIVLLESINLILAHYASIICTPIYCYALNYTGIFDRGLPRTK